MHQDVGLLSNRFLGSKDKARQLGELTRDVFWKCQQVADVIAVTLGGTADWEFPKSV